MRVSFRWLSEFINTGKGVEDISGMLTMAGLEVEAIELLPDDIMLEVNVTPNRADCLSILGVARELSVLSGKPWMMPPLDAPPRKKCGIGIVIEDADLCRRYAARVIRGLKVAPSPEWLVKRLENYGIRAINNIVDITNYTLIELGHPLHAFDLGKIKGNKIRIARADGTDGRLRTLDGVDRKKLPADAIVIADSTGPIALGGIMGGAFTEVEELTVDVLLEAAWFKPQSIRSTAKALGLASESSYRFERGADIEIIPQALDRASYLLRTIAGGRPESAADSYPAKARPARLKASPEKINRVLGTEISNKAMAQILKRLGFALKEKDGRFVLAAPSFRLDVEQQADIVEEVARIYGYGNIPVKLPSTSLSAEGLGKKQAFLRNVKLSMTKYGFSEAVNFSFMNPDMLDTLGIARNDPRRMAVSIMNPLRKEESLMRTTLIPSLLENLKRNLARGVRDVRLFEAARVFIGDAKEKLPAEPVKLGGVFLSQKTYRLWHEQGDEFYRVKGTLEALLGGFSLTRLDFRVSEEPFLHPGKSADIFIAGKRAGFVGSLAPSVKETLDIKTKEDPAVFEVDLGIAFDSIPAPAPYRPIPRFPSIERDIALVVDERVEAAGILELIKNYPSPHIEEAAVFDVYKDERLGPDKKSLAFNIRYRSAERTLTEQEIEETHKGLIAHLLEQTGGSLRE